MKTPTTYVVKRFCVCPDCDGLGVVEHPWWTKYWECHDRLLSDDDLRSWFQEECGLYPFDEIPGEERACPECDGYGRIEDEISLVDALKELGIVTEVAK